jgi:hypothetical protein
MNKGADIESGWLGNCGMGFWGQNSIRAQALFQPLVEEGQRQVKGAQIALVENGGGVIGMEEAVASVVILQRN